MKNYLAVYTGTPNGKSAQDWERLDDKARNARTQEGMMAWGKWVEQHKDSIVEDGGPLGFTKRVTESGITDIRNNLAAYTIVRANSQEEAAKMFLNHPHFMIFPGDGVEIMECLPIPME